MAKRTRVQFLAYVKRTFKRTDKDTEIYECLDETLDEMSTLYDFDVQKERWYISLVANQYDYTLPDNFGLMVGGVTFIDSEASSVPLTKLSKDEFDKQYPDLLASDVTKDDPESFCIFGNQIFIAPYLGTVSSEVIEIAGSEIQARLTADDSSADFDQWFEEVIKFGVLYRIFNMLEYWDAADRYKGLYGEGLQKMIDRDKNNADGALFVPHNDL